jgi:hypothetical protein
MFLERRGRDLQKWADFDGVTPTRDITSLNKSSQRHRRDRNSQSFLEQRRLRTFSINNTYIHLVLFVYTITKLVNYGVKEQFLRLFNLFVRTGSFRAWSRAAFLK